MSEPTRAPGRAEDNPASRRSEGAAASQSGRPEPSKHTPIRSSDSARRGILKPFTVARGRAHQPRHRASDRADLPTSCGSSAPPGARAESHRAGEGPRDPDGSADRVEPSVTKTKRGVEPLLRELIGAHADDVPTLIDSFDSSHPRHTPHYYLRIFGTHCDHRGHGKGLGLPRRTSPRSTRRACRPTSSQATVQTSTATTASASCKWMRSQRRPAGRPWPACGACNGF